MKKLFLISLSTAIVCNSNFALSGWVQDKTHDGQEATRLLSSYLKINTTNPPGNEKKGAEYLASVFKDNGIEAKVIETTENRAFVYARLKGTGKKRPVILLNHIDVVPACAEDWQLPPFSGEIKDGEIWGRGSIDMKSMGIAELEVMLMLHKSKLKLERDIIFLATPDEEVGGKYGANWFVEHHRDLIDNAEFLLNEGFYIEKDKHGKVSNWGVDISEKSVLWLKLTAEGQAGHASMPLANAATNLLIHALSNILNHNFQPQVLPAVREYFKEISKTENGSLKNAYENIDLALQDSRAAKEILQEKMKSCMLQNTISLTILKAGYKTNVIPAKAEAELDCRLLPGVDRKEFISQLVKIIANPNVKISIVDWLHTDASPFDTELFQDIKLVAKDNMPNVPVVPVIVPWFTDSHWFREIGIICYGFAPFILDEEHLATMHGKNERIPVNEFENGVCRLYQVLMRLCTTSAS